MVTRQFKRIAKTLDELARPDIAHSELLARVCELHPAASRRDIVRAALYASTDPAPEAAGRVTRLHDFALDLRRGLIECGAEPRRPWAGNG